MSSTVRIQGIREAAQALHIEGRVLNCTNVAQRCQISRRKLSYLVNETMPDLKEELQIVRSRGEDWRQRDIFAAYKRAAVLVQEEGNLPTRRLLADKLTLSLGQVQRYLRKHHQLADSLSLYTEDEALLWKSARTILNRGDRVTRMALADEMGRSYTTVGVILKARPKWIEDLGVCRDRYASGVWKRLYPKSRSE